MSTDIALLRSQVAELVAQEGLLLSRAFELTRTGDGAGVDTLFAQVQAIQARRNGVQKQIATLVGTQRMHVRSEVWKPGLYDYRPQVGGKSVRVRVVKGPLGLDVLFPAPEHATNIEALEGTFDGPLALDDAATPEKTVDARQDAAAGAGAVAKIRASAKNRSAKRSP